MQAQGLSTAAGRTGDRRPMHASRPLLPGSLGRRSGGRWPWPAAAWLPALSLVLPLVLLGAVATQSWHATFREAGAELSGTTDAAAEYALRVFSADLLAVARLDSILPGLEEAAYRDALRALLVEIPHAAAAFVIGADGRTQIAVGTHPGAAPVLDRATPAEPAARLAAASVDGQRVIALAGAGAGQAAASVVLAIAPDRFAADLRRFRRDAADVLALVQRDGGLLAITDQRDRMPASLRADSPYYAVAAAGLPEARYRSADPAGGHPLLVAARGVPGFPAYVTATRRRATILGHWAERMAPLAALGLAAMLALLALSIVVRRTQRRLEEANASLEARVAARTAELSDLSEALDLTTSMVLDLKGRIRHWSAGCEHLYGFTREEAEGRIASDLLRTEWPGGSDAALREGLLHDGEWRGELRQHRRDGTPLISAAHWILRRDPATGRAIGIVTTRADVTALRSAEQALDVTARRLRQAQEASGVIPFGVAADGTLHGGEALRTLLDWGEEAPADVGAVLARVHPEDRPALAEAQARMAREGGVFALEFRVLPPGDGLRWVHLRGEAEADPAGGAAPRSVLGVVLDITERRLAEAALAESEERLRLAQEAAGIGIFDYDLVHGEVAWDERLRAIWSVPQGRPVTPRLFLSALHPEDRALRRAALRRALAPGSDGVIRAEYRIIGIADRAERWVAVSGRVRRDPATGRAVRLIGAAFDVTARKQAELRNELLMREVDHRAKNALAVVQAALRLSRADTPAELVRIVEGRVAALARAQTLLAQRQWQGADLQLLLEGEFAAFLSRDGAEGAPRATLRGPPVTIGAYMAQPLSMALHELATNATKYGALSHPGGRVEVGWSLSADGRALSIDWRERGGPSVAGVPERRGFGSRVIEQTVTQQLGGRITRRWQSEGLRCVIEVPLRRDGNNAAPAAAA